MKVTDALGTEVNFAPLSSGRLVFRYSVYLGDDEDKFERVDQSFIDNLLGPLNLVELESIREGFFKKDALTRIGYSDVHTHSRVFTYPRGLLDRSEVLTQHKEIVQEALFEDKSIVGRGVIEKVTACMYCGSTRLRARLQFNMYYGNFEISTDGRMKGHIDSRIKGGLVSEWVATPFATFGELWCGSCNLDKSEHLLISLGTKTSFSHK